MIANNSILTQESNSFTLTQFYYSPQVILPPDNKNLQSLYGFISYQDPWYQQVFTSNVAETVITTNAGILSGSNILQLPEAITLNDFAIGQKVFGHGIPDNTVITELNEDDFYVTLSNNSTTNSISPYTFIGFVQNDKVTLYDENNVLSPINGFYNDCGIRIDVTNIPGELVYDRKVVDYDAATKTITVDSAFNDYPLINASSTVQLFYNNVNPPLPEDSIKYKKQVFKNMFYLKKITSNNISPVIRRINWVSGTVYDYYRDDINLYKKDNDGVPEYKFYIINQFNQVFKCLWNNNGGVSSVEPYFVAGNFDDNTNIFYDPDDGYKWKYMYTITYGDLQRFMDDKWMPVPVTTPPDYTASLEKAGGIEVINITNNGQGYDTSVAVVDVIIDGDGTGATAYAEVDNITNTIQNIVVKTPGSNYTEATVTISSLQGNSATAIASVSPIGGNGADILTELGCDRLMVTFMLSGSEDNKLPSDMQIRQIGLISSPMASSTYPYVANAETYITSTDIIVSNGFGTYQDGEIIYQTPNNSNIANATFTATCVNFEAAPNKIRAVNTKGIPITGTSIYGSNSGTARTLLQSFNPDLIKYTGHIIHIENREEIQRSSDGMELFRLVLKF